MPRNPSSPRLQVASWALYDWANSAFATVVLTAVFPIFYGAYWREGARGAQSTAELGYANAAASAAVALLAPVLGAIADRGGTRKRFLLAFMSLGAAMTGCLWLVSQQHWPLALGAYVFAVIGFAGANVFYDALLVSVASEERSDFVSALGFAVGYIGGGILYAFCLVLINKPDLFGLAGTDAAAQLSFLLVAVWWAVFSVPLFLFVDEPRKPIEAKLNLLQATRSGFTQLRNTFREIRALKPALMFLLAYWFYIDGVNTIIKMSGKYAVALELDATSVALAFLLVQFIGFPAALAFGKLGEKLGTRPVLLVAVIVYMGVTVYAVFLRSIVDFYILAVAVALVQGGVQSLSRSLYSRLIPRDKSGEFFGFYNMVGKFSSVVGPLLMGGTGAALLALTDNDGLATRLSILSVIILFAAGAFFLLKVPKEDAQSPPPKSI